MNKEKVIQYLNTTKQELVAFSCSVVKWVKQDLWPWIKNLAEKSIPVFKQIWTLLVEVTLKALNFVKVQIEKLTKKKKIEDKTNQSSDSNDLNKK